MTDATSEPSRVEAPAMHGANLAFRFMLELAALGAMSWWGYEHTEEPWRWGLAIGTPLLTAAAWGAFTTPGDPSRGGDGLVHIPGWARLGLELAVLGFATWALVDLGQTAGGVGYGSAVVVHYGLSYSRIAWLLGL